MSKNEILKLIRVEPTVGIQLQSALTRATIAQANDVGRYHLRSTRAAFLKRLKTQFFDKHGVSEQTAEHEQSMMENNQQNDTGPVISKPDTPLSTESPRVNSNADPDIITLPHRGSASNLQQDAPNIRRRAGVSRRASLTGAAGAVFTKPRLPVEKGRKVNQLFSANRVLYDSDDETHEVNKRVDKDERRPAGLTRSKAVKFNGAAIDSSSVLETSKTAPLPVVAHNHEQLGKYQDGVRRGPFTPEKDRRNSPERELQHNQQTQETITVSSPLGNTRSAARHLAKRQSVVVNNGSVAAITGTNTSTTSILSLPLKVAKAVKNVIHHPKEVKVENIRFERSVSLSELDFVETAGISHLKKFLKPSTSNSSLTAMDSGNNVEDSESAISRRVAMTSNRPRKGMIRKRRQTFPSKDQDLWRLQKIHQGVVI
jgi:hypothetical protein